MSEKRGRGQPKFEATRDLRNQVKLMKAAHLALQPYFLTDPQLRRGGRARER